MESIREIELEGHLIDSLILPRVLDTIMDMDGEFEILELDVGERKQDHSYAYLRVWGRDDEHVDRILMELQRIGARLPQIEDAQLERAPADRVVPQNFYSTTNHPTYVRVDGEWREVEDIEMDCLIVIRDGRAVCESLAHIKEGDRVVVGGRGVRIVPPERPREKSLFEFMGGGVSSERPSKNLIRQIAREIVQAKQDGGKIVVVGGPAIAHTGAVPALAELIRDGYVDVLLAGNALAAHDIEYNMYGTSLGMDLEAGEPVPGGHKHHIYAISRVIAAGSIASAVEEGIIDGGVMYECVQNDVPFVLAGSIRDDGPLPDVLTDSMEAQDAMAAAVRDADVVLMMATMLHSIATGNLLKSSVKTICVDIQPSAVTKLVDRGTSQAIGIVTDVGLFLPSLAEEVIRIE